ncbi:YeeE/YedE family protein [Aurantimonas aggregata]|uniref:YeeE/YedE family protein n=1 Tax=Aurantimonas aggregata TaxID=2047720 RepID=A0A6L9MCQ9_9HYPH|nr:DUF6691 family protein [Aurantimonas aggregata]NDV85468.1 YeeE/YedE family protein [Aurantimonas aggregata]
MRPLLGFLAGLLFGVGLVVAGMSDPAKVLNFLDIFGRWDPSLAFVMGGAAVTTFIGYRVVLSRLQRPLILAEFQIPTRQDIDRDLLVGAAIFGIGWGIGGFCPGPAWTSLALGAPGTLIFLPAMLAGMAIATLLRERRAAVA